MSEIEITLVLPSEFALRELQRGGHTVVKDLEKKEKSLGDAELSTADIRARRRVWEGIDGEEGVLGQIDSQLSAFLPAFNGNGAGHSSETRDMFDEAPVDTDPSAGPAVVELMEPEALRDRMANAGGLYIPAAAIARWPVDMRHEAQAWLDDMGVAFETGGLLPAAPTWLMDYPLPLGITREGDQLMQISPVEGEPDTTVHDPAAWLEEIAAGEIALAEEAALAGAPAEQPWVVVDVGYGEGLDRYQVMHRVTRERRRVDAGAVLVPTGVPVTVIGEGAIADAVRAALEAEADRGADGMTPEQIARAYAVLLSMREPEGTGAATSIEGDVEAGALLLRRALWEQGLPVPLASILAWGAEERVAAAEWAEAEHWRRQASEPWTDPPLFVRHAAVDLDTYPDDQLHPDEDFDEVLRAERAANGVLQGVVNEAAPDVAEDVGPAPALVVSLLENAKRIVPLEIVAGWTDAEREQVARWATEVRDGRTVTWQPQVLRVMTWAGEVDGALVAEIGAPPEDVLLFSVAGSRGKNVRVLDEVSGLFYGNNWGVAEAEHVRGRWASGMAADVGGETFAVRDERVLLEDDPKKKRAAAATA